MNVRPFCHRCGADLLRDVPVVINDFSMLGPGHPLCFCGNAIKLTPAESSVCWSLLKAYPDSVAIDVLLDRFDSEGGPDAIRVLISRIRRKMRLANIDNPIETVTGFTARERGYRWIARGDNETCQEVSNSARIATLIRQLYNT